MADTTVTSTSIKSVSSRNIHSGVYALYASLTDATNTPSASLIYLMLPLHRNVTVLDGWVKVVFDSADGSMDIMVGTPGNKSLFMSPTEVLTNTPLRFNQGIPHLVTITATTTFPYMKPLAVTIAAAVCGTLATTPVYTVMALLQND